MSINHIVNLPFWHVDLLNIHAFLDPVTGPLYSYSSQFNHSTIDFNTFAQTEKG